MGNQGRDKNPARKEGGRGAEKRSTPEAKGAAEQERAGRSARKKQQRKGKELCGAVKKAGSRSCLGRNRGRGGGRRKSEGGVEARRVCSDT